MLQDRSIFQIYTIYSIVPIYSSLKKFNILFKILRKIIQYHVNCQKEKKWGGASKYFKKIIILSYQIK